MNILIPIDNEKNLCSIESNNSWAVVLIEDGKTLDITFYPSKDEIKEFTDFVILVSQDETINDFSLEGIGILIAPVQRTIEDIIEAYMFRELHEVTL